MLYVILLALLFLVGYIGYHNNKSNMAAITDLKNQLNEKHADYVKAIDNVMELRVENEQLKKSTKEMQEEILNIQEEVGEEREKNKEILSQKKSSETRLGQISEHLVPFLENCQHEPKNMHFLGNPIDYIVFDFDEGAITFLEVKSGNSKPSRRQKTVKHIIRSGRIFYEEIRINEKGIKSKIIGGEDQNGKN